MHTFMCAQSDSFMCDTHTFMCDTHTFMCDTHTFMCDTHTFMCDTHTFMYVTHRHTAVDQYDMTFYECDTTHSREQHDSFTCVTHMSRLHVMNHMYRQDMPFFGVRTHACVTHITAGLMHMGDTHHSSI